LGSRQEATPELTGPHKYLWKKNVGESKGGLGHEAGCSRGIGRQKCERQLGLFYEPREKSGGEKKSPLTLPERGEDGKGFCRLPCKKIKEAKRERFLKTRGRQCQLAQTIRGNQK